MGWIRYESVMTSGEPSWEEEAACSGKPTELFELGDPKELTLQRQHELIAEGLKICSTCPVMDACKADASTLDGYWTTRGGVPPEGLFQDSVRPNYSPAEVTKLAAVGARTMSSGFHDKQETCQRGHNDWRTRADGTGRECNTCKRERDRAGVKARRKRARMEKAS